MGFLDLTITQPVEQPEEPEVGEEVAAPRSRRMARYVGVMAVTVIGLMTLRRYRGRRRKAREIATE